MVKHWNWLPRGVVDALSLSRVKRHLDNALNLLSFLVSPEVPRQLDFMVILCPFQLEYSVLIMKACSMDIQQEFLYFKIMTISEDENFLWTLLSLEQHPIPRTEFKTSHENKMISLRSWHDHSHHCIWIPDRHMLSSQIHGRWSLSKCGIQRTNL